MTAKTKFIRIVHGVVLLAAVLLVTAEVSAETRRGTGAALWAALRSGDAFAMMRHATAPGTGDPPGFSADDCATQRNLSDAGRDEARRTGALFRANGIAAAELRSSVWCRCRDTAELLDLGPVQVLEPLNSFFDTPTRGEGQTRTLRDWLASRTSKRPLVLVTHQVNVTALTGVYPRSGEVVVARIRADGTVAVLGSLPPVR